MRELSRCIDCISHYHATDASNANDQVTRQQAMKYMGSKRAMLQNGLGELLGHEVGNARRFVDLFAGSGAVAIHIARRVPIRVLAFDLQHYSAVLTSAVISRKAKLNWRKVWDEWECAAKVQFYAAKPPSAPKLTQAIVADFRSWCNEQATLPISKAYGGHYFSPRQAGWLDALRGNLPLPIMAP